MSTRCINEDLTYDRAAILRQAWMRARSEFSRSLHDTLRQAFAAALRWYWDQAKFYRNTALWRIEQAAQKAAMTAEQARVYQLEQDIASASLIDSTAEYFRVREHASAELAALQQAA